MSVTGTEFKEFKARVPKVTKVTKVEDGHAKKEQHVFTVSVEPIPDEDDEGSLHSAARRSCNVIERIYVAPEMKSAREGPPAKDMRFGNEIDHALKGQQELFSK